MRFSDRAEIKIAFSFLLISVLWIVFSDRLFLQLNKNLSLESLTFWQTGKGLLFIGIVTILIYTLVRRSNLRLFKSREQYKMFFDDNPNPMMIFDTQTLSIVKVNNAAMHKYGYSPEEFYTMTIRDLRSEEDAKKLLSFLPALPKNNFTPGQWRHIKKNGDIIDVQITSCATSFDNYPKCRLVLVHDVSEVLKTQKKIDQKEKLYASLVDSQSNFLVRIDPLGNFSFTNKSFVKTFVPQPDNIIPFRFIEIVEKTDENKFRKALTESYKNPDDIIDITLHCKPFTGTGIVTVHWELKAITDNMNQVTEIQCVGFDISEKKTLEQTISTLNNLLNHITEGFMIFNLEGTILNCNEKLSYLTGIPMDTLLKSNIEDLTDAIKIEDLHNLPGQVADDCPGISRNITINNRLLQLTFCRINELISVVVKDLTIEKSVQDDIHSLSDELEKALQKTGLSGESKELLLAIQQRLQKRTDTITRELRMVF